MLSVAAAAAWSDRQVGFITRCVPEVSIITAVAGRRLGGRERWANNPAEAFYLNHSSSPFKLI